MSDSESSDDYNGILKKALNVELPSNFNPNGIPQTGEEYLHHVIYERMKCKKLITINIDRNKFQKRQTFYISKDNIAKEAPTYSTSSKDWQKNKIEDFIVFREFVLSQIFSESFLLGFDEECFLEIVNIRIPLFSDITKYSQSCKIRMLQIITNYLDLLKPGETINDNLGIWVYAILTLLEIPLSPDSCYTLREFARKCIALRSKLLNIKKTVYTSLDLYICIIAIFFNQLDLAD